MRSGWRTTILVAAPVVSGCRGPQNVLDPAAVQGDALLALLNLVLAVGALAYIAVLCALAWSVWRTRGSASAPTAAKPGDAWIDRGMLAWSLVVVVGLLVIASASFLVDRSFANIEPRPTLEVRVTGHQWWWRLEYRDPGGDGWIEAANELHLPRGRTARLLLRSEDVIHSFWVPNVAGKLDLVPGRTNALDVTPHREGWFRGQCAEFCGTQHAHMSFDVRVDDPVAFDAWLDAQRRPRDAPGDAVLARGEQVMGGACAACHAVRGSRAVGRSGPDLTHVGSRRSIAAGTLPMNRGALQGWISQPQVLKPGTLMPAIELSADDANAVAAYLMSLR